MSSFPFLCKGVTSADLRYEGKVKDLTVYGFPSKFCKNVNIFLYNFGRDIRTLRCFIQFQFMNFFFNTCQIYFFKSKFYSVLTIILFWIARMLGWSLYFRIALKVGSLTWFITGSKFEYWFISRFFTIFPKKVFKTSAVSKSVFKIFSFFYQINLLFDAWFILKWRLYYFRKEPIVRHFFLV